MSRKFITFILFISTLIVIGGLTVYFLTAYSYVKVISLINLYDKDISVNMNGTTYTLLAFDTRLFEIKDLRHLTLSAAIGETSIASETFDLSYNSQAIGFYFSDIEHCYYETDLSTELESVTHKGVEMSFKYLIVDNINLDKNNYFLPGSNLIDMDENKQTIGYLPVLCSDIDNKDVIATNNKLFLNYNSELQRQYYFENVDKINNSESLNELGEVKGIGKSIIHYFNFGKGDILFIPE